MALYAVVTLAKGCAMLRTRSAATLSVRRSDLIKRCLFSTLSEKAAIAQASISKTLAGLMMIHRGLHA